MEEVAHFAEAGGSILSGRVGGFRQGRAGGFILSWRVVWEMGEIGESKHVGRDVH